MSVFVVVSTRTPNDNLKQQIALVIPEGKYHELNDTAWMVEYEGTTRDLATKLDILRSNGVPGSIDSTVIYLVSNYSGFASPFIWEWLKARPGTRPE